jgi:hypothetical protein
MTFGRGRRRAMTEEELFDVVIDHAVDCALELMAQGRVSACDTPPTLRLARALVREVFPIFRVELHRPREERRLSAQDCRDLVVATVSQVLLE